MVQESPILALDEGVCSQDGCSQAPRDGFMASLGRGQNGTHRLINDIEGNLENHWKPQLIRNLKEKMSV